MPRHRLRDAVWASLHAKLVAIPGIWKKDTERLRLFIEAVAFVLRTGVAWEDLYRSTVLRHRDSLTRP